MALAALDNGHAVWVDVRRSTPRCRVGPGDEFTQCPVVKLLHFPEPLNPDSFWSVTLRPYCGKSQFENLNRLIAAVDALFWEWKGRFKNRTELPLSRRPYSLDDGGLTVGAGIIQRGAGRVHLGEGISDR